MSQLENFGKLDKSNFIQDNISYCADEEILETIKEGKSIIIAGPPGTGKTRIVSHIIKSEFKGNGLSIQFHPNYRYADFIEGYEPSETGFKKKHGLFLNLIEKINEAKNSEGSNKDDIFILHIDEINRANIAEVFGELLYLLDDKEEKTIELSITKRKIFFPKNLVIVGTMNSSDRSTKVVDFALRRRFDFFFYPPNYDSITAFYNELSVAGCDTAPRVSEAARTLNSRISRNISLGKNYQLGQSFYFFDGEKTIDKLYNLFRRKIFPQIESYLGSSNEKELASILSPIIAAKIVSGDRIHDTEIKELINILSVEYRNEDDNN